MLEFRNVGFMISSEELARILGLDWNLTFKKIDKFESLLLLHKVEVHTVLEGLNIQCEDAYEIGFLKKWRSDRYLQTIRVGVEF
jgi:hypothetical protein